MSASRTKPHTSARRRPTAKAPRRDGATPFERLEDRRLMSATTVQTLPFRLDFATQQGAADDVLDKDGERTGFTRVQANKNGTQYQPGLIDLDRAAGVLRVTTTGSGTSGGNAGSDNTLTNALETQFDGTGTGFTVTARLVGPLGNLNDPYEQAGIFVGPDQDNFVKFVAVRTVEGQRLQVLDEWSLNTGGTYSTLNEANSRVDIGNFANVQTLDLRLTGRAGSGTLTAQYAVNGGSFQDTGFTVNVPAAKQSAVFANAARAGLIQFHKNNLGPITATYDSFAIETLAPSSSVVATGERPAVTDTTPADGATDVRRDLDGGLTSNIRVAGNGGVDATTLGAATVKLYRAADGRAVEGYSVTTSGGADTITLTLAPGTALDAETAYTFEVTEGVKDVDGRAFLPYKATFTTGLAGKVYDAGVSFAQSPQMLTEGKQFTSVTVGPDRRLYATTLDGEVNRFDIAADGSLTNALVIKTIQTRETTTSNPKGFRIATGLVFDPQSTATNLIAYVTHGQFAFGENGSPKADDWTGKITKLTGASLQNGEDKVVSLPRSIRDHLTNQAVFGPDGKLYFAQAANTAMGAPDNAWGNRHERLLSAAVLQVDVRNISGTLDVRTPEGGGTYDPRPATAPVRIYATGVRNAYDLVWHSNGRLYAPTNGSAAHGATPEAADFRPGDVTSGNNNKFDNFDNTDFSKENDFGAFRIDAATRGAYNGPRGPGIIDVSEKEQDWLFDVQSGGYYGHPNPIRDEWIYNAGNVSSATLKTEANQYPLGTQPDRNFRGAAFDFGESKSPNGAIEYRGNAFGGALNNKLLVTRFNTSNDILVMSLDSQGRVTGAKDNYVGLDGFNNPVDVAQDPQTGFLYVAEFDRSNTGVKRITLLKPTASTGTVAVSRTTVPLNAVLNDAAGSGPQTVTVRNTGTGVLRLTNLSVSGPNASQFRVVDGPSGTAVIPAGGTLDVKVNFLPTGTSSDKGLKTATLTLTTDDPAKPTLAVALRGLAATGRGGQDEPSLQRLLDLYQIPVNVGDPDPTTTALPGGKIAASDEVDVQRLVKAGSGNVTVELLGVFGVDTKPTVVDFGYYSPGTPANATRLFKVGRETAQSVNPVADGTLSFDPAGGPFALYGTFPHFKNKTDLLNGIGGTRTVHSEDSLNTWAKTTAERRKVRFFPLKGPDGAVVPNAYVFAFEEYDLETDQNDVVGIIRNVAPAPAGGEVGLESLDRNAPAADHLVMSRLRDLDPTRTKSDGTVETAYPNFVHDAASVVVRNTGSLPLNLGAPSISNGDFTITAGGGARTLAPGASVTVTVKFVYNRTGTGNELRTATLTLPSDDADEPVTTVRLSGLWQSVSEQPLNSGTTAEPKIEKIFETFGYKVIAGNVDTDGRVQKVGQETLSSYWRQADASSPVEVVQLAAYHGQDRGKGTNFRWFEQGRWSESSQGTVLFSHGDRYGQALLPRIDNSTQNLAAGRFDPAGKTFGVSADGFTSDAAINSGRRPSDDGHAMRWYAARDADGKLIPDTYLVGHDYTGVPGVTNYDYQDNIYLVRNVRPVDAPTRVAGLTATAGNGGVTLRWSPNAEGNVVGYDVFRRVGTSGEFVKLTADGPAAGASYVDATAPAGERSYYRVAAVDQHGQAGEAATADALRTGTAAVPAAPTNLSAVATGPGRVELSWNDNAANETGFRIERRTGGGAFQAVFTTAANATSFVDTAVAASTQYTYRVVATNAAGDSAPTNENTATTPANPTNPNPTPTPNPNPAAPGYQQSGGFVAFEAEGHDGVVDRNGQGWAPDSTRGDSVGQSLFAGPNSGVKVDADVVGNSPRVDYKVNFTTAGTFYVWVRGYGPNGGDDSLHVGVDGAVAAFNLSGFNTGAGHGWSNAANGGRATITVPTAGAHTVSFWMREDGVFVDRALLTTDPNFVPTGTGPAASQRVTGTTPAPTPPAAPSGLTASATAQGSGGATSAVALAWADNSADESNFRVERRVGTSGAWAALVDLTANATSYTDATAQPGTSYGYRVSAVNAAGTSAPSNVATATTAPASPSVPASPSGLSATVDAQNRVALSWADNSGDEAGFRVERRTGGGASGGSTSGWSALADVAAGATSYTDVTAAAGTQYGYRVSAFNAAGASAPTGEATATTSAAPTPPAAAGALSATVDAQKRVVLAWQDRSADETGFRVERRTGTSGAFAALASVPANTTGFTDATAVAGETYGYRVVAVNAVGDAAPSNVASATVPANQSGGPAAYQQSGDGLVVFEAEANDGTVDRNGQGWTPDASVPGAAGTGGLVVAPNNGVKVDADVVGNSPRVDFTVNFTRAGTHYVWVRGYGPSGGDDSVHAGVGGAVGAFNVTGFGLSGYEWTNSAGGARATVSVPTAGVHTFSLWMREDGSHVDRVLLTPDATYRPAGVGPAASERSAGTATPPPAPQPTAPAAPGNLSASAVSQSQVTLAWSDNAGDETGYEVERRTGGGAFVRVATVGANVTSYADGGLSASTGYEYRVRAINNVGPSAYSATASATTQAAPAQPPTQPGSPPAYQQSGDRVVIEAEGFDANVSQGGASWTPYGGTAGASGGALEAGPNVGNKVDSNVLGNSPRLDYQVNFAAPGKYYVWVRGDAVDGNDNSVHAGLNGAVSAQAMGLSVDTGVGWTWSNRAGFNADAGRATITVTTAGVHTLNLWMREDGIRVDRLLVTTDPNYTPSGVGPATSERTAPPTQPPAQPATPAAPSNLTAAVSDGSVDLTWSDRSDNEDLFQVYRSVGGSNSFELVGTTAANATTFRDTAVTAGASYTYRVRAVGNQAGPGDYSNDATATVANPTPTPTPAASLSSADVGSPTPAGTTVVVAEGRDYDLTVGGRDVWAGADSFRFASTAVTGDFDVSVRVASISGNNDSFAMGGLMARDGLADNARNVFVKATQRNGNRFTFRSNTGGGTAAVGSGPAAFPNAYVRLVRVGNTLIGYQGSDGTTWTEVGRTTTSLPTTLQVGLAASGHSTTAAATASFRGLTFA